MDMHGEMGPIADKMSKAMSDAPAIQQRMVRQLHSSACSQRAYQTHTYALCGRASVTDPLVADELCTAGRRRYVYGKV